MSNIWFGDVNFQNQQSIATTSTPISDELILMLDTLQLPSGEYIKVDNVVKTFENLYTLQLNRMWTKPSASNVSVMGFNNSDRLETYLPQLDSDYPNALDHRLYIGNRLMDDATVVATVDGQDITVDTYAEFTSTLNATRSTAVSSLLSSHQQLTQSVNKAEAKRKLDAISHIRYDFIDNTRSDSIPTERSTSMYHYAPIGQATVKGNGVSGVSYLPTRGLLGLYCDTRQRTNIVTDSNSTNVAEYVSVDSYVSSFFGSQYGAYEISELGHIEPASRYAGFRYAMSTELWSNRSVIVESDARYITVGTMGQSVTPGHEAAIIDLHNGTIVSTNDPEGRLLDMSIHRIRKGMCFVGWRSPPSSVAQARTILIGFASPDGSDYSYVGDEGRKIIVHSMSITMSDNRPVDVMLTHPLPIDTTSFVQGGSVHKTNISSTIQSILNGSNPKLNIYIEWECIRDVTEGSKPLLMFTGENDDLNHRLVLIRNDDAGKYALTYRNGTSSSTSTLASTVDITKGVHRALIEIDGNTLSLTVDGVSASTNATINLSLFHDMVIGYNDTVVYMDHQFYARRLYISDKTIDRQLTNG